MSTLTIARLGWRYPAHSMAALMAASAVADAVWVEVRRSGDGKLLLWDGPELGGREVASTRWVVLANTDLGDGHRPTLLDEALVALRGTPIVVHVANDPGAPGYEPDHRLVLEVAERARPHDLVIVSNPESLARLQGRFEDLGAGLYLRDSAETVDTGTLVIDLRGGIGRAFEAIEMGATVVVDRVESPDDAEELATLGVWGIITTQPEVIRAAIERSR